MASKLFVQQLQDKIERRKKMTSPLYQTILAGNASGLLLQSFVLHRIPIKSLWTRNILGIASRVEDYQLRVLLLENIYEEETGKLSGTCRHLDSFMRFGKSVGLSDDDMLNPPLMPQTQAVIEHNLKACNSEVHFTAGVAAVLLLMEGQPPINSVDGCSMARVMREEYGFPESALEFFYLHASQGAGATAVSELEDDHAEAARELLRRYCDTQELQRQASEFLENAIDLRHRHFDAIFHRYHRHGNMPFRWNATINQVSA